MQQQQHDSSSSSSMASLEEAINRKELQFAAICALVGIAALYVAVPRSSEPAIHSKRSKDFALNPKQWVNFTLQESHPLTHNTRIYRFTFDPNAKLGLPVASCLLTRAVLTTTGSGRSYSIIRPYTPISDPNAKGYCDLMVKFYPEGKMSRHIAQLKPGDTLEVNGPVTKLPYKANMKRHLGMIAGGTGITPMLQIIDAILSNPNDYTQLSLLYANLSPENILLKDNLDALAHAHPNFKVFYMVDIAATDWTGGLGRINKDVIMKGLPHPSRDTLILVSGPPGLVEHVCGDKEDENSQGELAGLLKEIGYKMEQVYKF
ncbi:hypothetical protein BDL97_05G026900 [Sphagnum fallax]|nr:hypothetical protein BDL97_05G026900 [Sphagnum fallax]KAH8960995.1 hypothetical protein BDL97_05G026900 [Sphagnum fallax]